MAVAARKSLETLGYTDVPAALHLTAESVPREHAYALEMRKVFAATQVMPEGASVLGVYEVDGVPAVCLVEGRPGVDLFEDLRGRLWNQGLISLVLILGDEAIQAMPVARKIQAAPPVPLQQLTRNSPYSAYGVRSEALKNAHSAWFDSKTRVDRYLLRNIDKAIRLLLGAKAGFTDHDAQHLVGQAMFVSYLEHRELITEAFRKARGVQPFVDLLAAHDGAGMDKLLRELKERFNGDFLEPEGRRASWSKYPDAVFDILHRFLRREDLKAGQQSAWPYDFSQIPVELLSGIYEKFLGERQKQDAAYYTPRHLANLAVDELFRGIEHPDQEVVWDGACGSGILLTTAFRRMLGAAEAVKGAPLSFSERISLLTSRIYGGDTNLSACKVTAFSLYLCLLEDLAAPPRTGTLLPRLLDKNIFTDRAHGDAFSEKHPITMGVIPKPSCVVSNPPWLEPSTKGHSTSADKWAARHNLKVPLRQVALTYADMVVRRAEEGARIVLIMPASVFLRRQPHAFVRRWLTGVQLERIINLSDLRNFLFPGAKHPCVVAVMRSGASPGHIPPMFDYATPKADATIHYGRLTIYPSDRRRLSQSRVQMDAGALQSLHWCSEPEVAAIARLRAGGTLGNIEKAGQLISGTGFHVTDRASERPPVAPGFLRDIPHIAATTLPKFGPSLSDDKLKPWPKAYSRIASQGNPELYQGRRVIVPNGMTPSHRIRAFAVEATASVTNSCSVLRLTDNNPDTAYFLAAYLSSRLAAYLAMVLAPSAVTERTQIKCGELLHLPFFLPANHDNPQHAAGWVGEVAKFVRGSRGFSLTTAENDLPEEIERLVRKYFGIDPALGQVIDEVATMVLPNIQPTTIAKLPSPLQSPPISVQMQHYAEGLASQLTKSRDALDGSGRFKVSVTSWQAGASGGMGLVRVSVDQQEGPNEIHVGTAAATAVLNDLSKHGLLGGVANGGLTLAGDILIREKNAIYFAKPLVNRLWLTSAALDDALRIVRSVEDARA